MADDKATALKEAKYTVNLILGTSPESVLPVSIDITDAVVSAVGKEKLINGDGGDKGIANAIIGIEERVEGENVGYYKTETLRTSRGLLFIRQDIIPIINASIVNQAQREAVMGLIDNVFNKRVSDAEQGLKVAISAVPFAKECERVIDEHIERQKSIDEHTNW